MEADDSAISADASTFSVCLGLYLQNSPMLMLADEKAHLFFYLTPFFLVSFCNISYCATSRKYVTSFCFFCYEKGAPFNLN